MAQGFYGPSSSDLVSANPYTNVEGTDWYAVYQSPDIDFCW